MKKVISVFIIMLLLISLTSCTKMNNDKETISQNHTPIMRVLTPEFYCNTIGLPSIVDPQYVLLPVKSAKIINSTNSSNEAGIINVRLKTNFTEEEEKNINRFANIFRYNDMSKYSVLEYELVKSDLAPIIDHIYLAKFLATLELEFYPEEVLDTKIYATLKDGEYTTLKSWDEQVHLIVSDVFGGEDTSFASIAADENGSYARNFIEAYESIQNAAYEEYIKNPEFISAAKDIEKSFSDSEDVTKALAIYNWITKNVTYNGILMKQLTNSDYVISNSDFYEVSATYALINKTTMCEGYAYLFNGFARYFGLSSYIVNGKTDPEIEAAHAWNFITTSEGQNIFIDCTWKQFELPPYDTFSDNHYVYNGDEYVPFVVE